MAMKKWRREILELVRARREPTVVTYRTFTVCFSKKTVDIDGRTITVGEPDCITIPMLSGDAIFMAKNMDRIA